MRAVLVVIDQPLIGNGLDLFKVGEQIWHKARKLSAAEQAFVLAFQRFLDRTPLEIRAGKRPVLAVATGLTAAEA